MLNKKEIFSILTIAIILAFTISLIKSLEIFLYAFLMIFLVIIINIFAKKITSHYFDSEIEIKIWEIHRWGILSFFKHIPFIGRFFNYVPFIGRYPSREFKRAFPIGAFLPILVILFSFGYVTWMGNFVFDVKAKIYRAAKRHGLYSFSEMTEDHIGFIASAGIIANLAFAIIGYLIGFPEFAKLNIFYAFFNILPISDLDGNKIFFGSIVLWSFLAALILIGMGYVFLVI